jgi:hypothetical protein
VVEHRRIKGDLKLDAHILSIPPSDIRSDGPDWTDSEGNGHPLPQVAKSVVEATPVFRKIDNRNVPHAGPGM